MALLQMPFGCRKGIAVYVYFSHTGLLPVSVSLNEAGKHDRIFTEPRAERKEN